MMHPLLRFCSNCAGPLHVEIPPDDGRPRHVCAHCGAVHYRNPRLVVGVIATWEDRILLCRRAIEPRRGLWTLPAGFHEVGESTADGALRETREEAGASVQLDGLLSMIDVLHAEQVHLFYRGRMTSPALDPGPESLEAGLFDEADIPWDQIAFRTVAESLKWFLHDRRAGRFELHTASIGTPVPHPDLEHARQAVDRSAVLPSFPPAPPSPSSRPSPPPSSPSPAQTSGPAAAMPEPPQP